MIKTMQLGALKDRKDMRDYPIKAYLTVNGSELPLKVDLREKLSPVRNQGSEGSCVSFAVTAAKEYDEGMKEQYLSPRFMTNRIQPSFDSGAYPRDAMAVLLKEGVCPEECQPYQARASNGPCEQAIELAASNKIKAYARLETLDEMKRYLFERGVFMASFTVTNEWFSPVNGLVIPQSQVVGGHAVAVVGYDDEKQQLKFKNSWGEGWGENGYGYLPYVSVGQYLMDAWSMVDVPEEEEIGMVPVMKTWFQLLCEWLGRLFTLSKTPLASDRVDTSTLGILKLPRKV